MKTILLMTLFLTGCQYRSSICERQCLKTTRVITNGEEMKTISGTFSVTNPIGQEWPWENVTPLEGCTCLEGTK